MHRGLRPLRLALAVLIFVGTFAGLVAAMKRFHVEARNRRVQIGVEYAEVDTLAQASGLPISSVLQQFKTQRVGALVLSEDTLGALELVGAAHVVRIPPPTGISTTGSTFGSNYASNYLVELDTPATFARVHKALRARGIPDLPSANASADRATHFVVRGTKGETFAVGLDYAHLRSLGIGLAPEAVQTARVAQMQIVGRIGNFPGVTPASAGAVLANLHAQGATLVIFSGEDILGYRGQELEVAKLFRPNGSESRAEAPLLVGEVEFGKQRGDEKLSAALHGDFVRVHSVQAAELGQLTESDVVERFVRAARERNIRFCYVRLPFTAGADAVEQNAQVLKQIARGIERGNVVTGGGYEFGVARPFDNPGVGRGLFFLLALGVAAGLTWMTLALCSIPDSAGWRILLVSLLLCVGLAVLGDTGRRLLALLAGIAFPTVGCLTVLPAIRERIRGPQDGDGSRNGNSGVDLTEYAHGDVLYCLAHAFRNLALASVITLLGVIHVVGLLATREYMVHANQFLGIKAQHAAPLLLVAFAVLVGGAARSGETFRQYRLRVETSLRWIYAEPARFGVLILGLIGVSVFVLIVARTGNDAGVGVSSMELKARALLDRLLPVRPRTKEFLLGHPALMLALAWRRRGRVRLALPVFVIGSIGQASLLNTFCHIHTPLIVSLWRGGLGLAAGATLGGCLFMIAEMLLPAPSAAYSVVSETDPDLRPNSSLLSK